MAPQLIGTNGALRRGEVPCTACAASSLPLPLAPDQHRRQHCGHALQLTRNCVSAWLRPTI
jgi:hypothetical protein